MPQKCNLSVLTSCRGTDLFIQEKNIPLPSKPISPICDTFLYEPKEDPVNNTLALVITVLTNSKKQKNPVNEPEENLLRKPDSQRQK